MALLLWHLMECNDNMSSQLRGVEGGQKEGEGPESGEGV